MRIVRKEKKNKKQKQIVEQKKKVYTPWKVRSKKHSKYPYIITVSFFRKNVFLSASDLRGRIKCWTNAGRLGFKGADKTQYMAIVTVAETFFKKLTRYGIRDVFIKFKNYKRPRHAIKKAIKKLKLAGRKGRRKNKNKQLQRWKWQTKYVKGKRIREKVFFKIKTTQHQRKMRFLGIWTELHVSFNGCRNKKHRRKRQRRRAKRIRLR